MNSMQAKVKEFHAHYSLPDPSTPSIPPAEIVSLRMRLISEEMEEFEEATAAGDMLAAIKELSDLLYVVLGAANAYGVDIEPFFDEVHRSNMTKTWPDGSIHKDEQGKVLKPPTYSPARLDEILTAQQSPL
jgi:predicted HAD superfamily Cof-like phosphohydrolase